MPTGQSSGPAAPAPTDPMSLWQSGARNTSNTPTPAPAAPKTTGPGVGSWGNYNGPTPPPAGTWAQPATPPAYGSQSGPGILQQWFNQRASGTDPGWQYATGAATDAINAQSAARGGYNGSGAMQSIGNMYANATAQRESQLDSLAQGASTEHQNQLNNMFLEGTNIANGETGATAPYGTAAGSSQEDSNTNLLNLILGKANANQTAVNGQLGALGNIVKFGAGQLNPASGGGGSSGGGGGLLSSIFQGGGAAAAA